MKNIILLTAILLSWCYALSAQQPAPANPISNVTVRISDEQDKVTVSYDLARNSRVSFYSIKVKITLDGELVSARGLSGDLGAQVLPGLGKKIVWDVHQDLSELAGELKIEVSTDTPTPNSGPCIPIKTLPVYAGLGSVAAGGAGLLIGGLGLENDSKALYDVYTANLDPDDPIYADLSREDHYNDANSKHKQGTWLMVAGGATLVTGGVIFAMRLIKVNNYNKRCAGKMGAAPRWDLQPLVFGGTATAGAGLSLTYRF